MLAWLGCGLAGLPSALPVAGGLLKSSHAHHHSLAGGLAFHWQGLVFQHFFPLLSKEVIVCFPIITFSP